MNAVAGKRVLIVEDDAILAMVIEDILTDAGFEVVGPAAWLKDALYLVDTEELDLAILDVNINGGRTFAVAESLTKKEVPYLFATGYGVAGIDCDRVAVPVLQKPFRDFELLEALERIAIH